MNAGTLLSLSLYPLWRKLRRRKIRAEMKSIERQLEQIAKQRSNDFRAECLLQGRHAILKCDLHNL